MSAEVKSMKEWALYYAELGLAVFPLAYRNKVPAIEGGCKAATTEKSKIERWWNQNPRYNIGIATGNKSNGLVVIDLDVDKNKGIDGYEVLRDWQNKHGELPETWQSITGRGGYHYFYKDTITHSNKVGLYEGVDIRGEGGYIVAPPSVHPNGNTYEWEQEPKEYEIAQVDDIVNDFFKGEKQRIDSEHKTNFKVPELIPEGKRVDTIVRLIASLRTKGLDDDAIKAAVRVENEKRCNPPLKEKELEKAVFPALKRDWQVNSPYYNNFNAMNENDNKYVNEVLKKLNELNAVERFPMNDRGSADLFATIFKNVSRYNPTKKDWMYYDKTRWTADTEGMRAKRNAKMLADVLVRYSVTASLPDDKRQSYIKYAAGMMNYRNRNVMITDAKDLNFFENTELDKDDFLINCRNCVLDLSEDQPKVLEHNADLLLSKICNAPFVSIAPWSFIKDECIVKYYPEGHYQKPEQITTTLHDALMIAQYYYECGLYVQFTMSLCIEWLFLFVRDDPRYSPPQQKSWYTKCTEEYPEITAMLESEQRSEIIGTLRRMPQNFLFKGLPDDIKDDYKLMDF